MSNVQNFLNKWNNRYVWLLGDPSTGNRECVALFWRWNYDYNSGETYAAPGAQDLWKGYTSWNGYERILPTHDLKVGDWVLWDGYSGAYPNGGSGHVAMWLSDNGNGTGQFFSQNPNPAQVMTLSYNGVLGYLRPRVAAPKPPAPVKPKPNQRVAGSAGVVQRLKPNVSSPQVRKIPGNSLETFTGWVEGESYNGNNIWYVDAKGYAWTGGFTSQSKVGLKDLTVRRPTPKPTQRYAGGGNVNQRATANTGAKVVRVIPGRSLETFTGFVRGQKVTVGKVTTDVWYKDNLGVAWAGGFETQSTVGLQDLTEETQPVPTATHRIAGKTDVNQRAKALVGAAIVRVIPGGSLENFTGFVHGEVVTIGGLTTDVWFADPLGFAWAGGFTSQATAGLKDLTPIVVPPVVPSPIDPVPEQPGLPVLNVVDLSRRHTSFDPSKIKDLHGVYIVVTAGMKYLNENWKSQLDAARKAGKVVALFHIRAADSVGTAREEADRFLSFVRPELDGKTPIGLDWEECDVSDTAWVASWNDYVKATAGMASWLYMNQSTANSYNWSAVSGSMPLVCAQYPYRTAVQGWQSWDNPPVLKWWDGPVMWQYSENGVLPGYAEEIDLNMFLGSVQAWEAAGQSSNNVGAPDEPYVFTTEELEILAAAAKILSKINE